MKKFLPQLIVFGLFALNMLTLLFDWYSYPGITAGGGLLILTRHLLPSVAVLGVYCLSIALFRLCKKLFFFTGLGSLGVLAAWEIAEFARYADAPHGPTAAAYLGLATMLITIAGYSVILGREAFRKPIRD